MNEKQSTAYPSPLYVNDVAERLREIVESIVDVTTEEGKFLLRVADEYERLHRIAARWKHNSEELGASCERSEA